MGRFYKMENFMFYILATENTSKRITRKAAAKAIVEPAEEMALTPSRRSARIKSNSSIVSETTTYESPRTRRAVRRLSQAGMLTIIFISGI